MDDTIVSIYDLLMKRHRQQRISEQQKDLKSKTVSEIKKPRLQKCQSKLSGDMKYKHGWTKSTNVVTATHLTQKRSAIVIPPPTKKDVLNQLVEKMSGKRLRKPPADSSDISPSPSKLALPKKPKLKAKLIKSSRGGSASSSSRMRLALSPRNKNLSMKPKVKRESKASVEPKLARAKNPEAIKLAKLARESKTSNTVPKSPKVEKPARYRI